MAADARFERENDSVQNVAIDLRSIIDVFRRHARLIMGSVAIGFLAALLYIALVPREYTASVKVEIYTTPSRPLINTAFSGANSGDIAVVETQLEILGSQRIAARVIKQLSLSDDLVPGRLAKSDNAAEGWLPADWISWLPADWISWLPADWKLHREGLLVPEGHKKANGSVQSNAMIPNKVISKFLKALTVERSGLSSVLQVSFRAATPINAAMIVNAVADSYLEDRIETQSNAIQLVIDWLRQSIAEAEAKLRQADSSSISLIATLDELHKVLLAKLAEAQTQHGLKMPKARILSYAVAPEKPSHPKVLLVLALGLVGGLGSGIMLASVKESTSDVVRTGDDLERAFQIPVLAVLSDLDSSDGAADFDQALFLMKQALFVNGETEKSKIVTVISAQPREGRSTVSVKLSQYAASVGLKTLLIDADLRHPEITSRLPDVPTRSIDDVLKGAAELKDVVIKIGKNSFDFLPGVTGGFVERPMEITASKEFRALFEKAAQAYQLTVVDTSPLVPFVDAQALVRASDGAIMVVECDKTSLRHVHACVQRVEREKANIIGFALNKAEAV